MAGVMIFLFVALNAVVVWLVFHAVHFDDEAVLKGTYAVEHRVITKEVYMSLVGSVVVQAGVVFVAITSYLFPKAGTPVLHPKSSPP